jgi:glycosyltransferase involved in cell wall biosynthesis
MAWPISTVPRHERVDEGRSAMTSEETHDTGRAPTSAGPSPRVLLIVEQLRRAVPGGIGRYIDGLLHGVAEMVDGGETVPELILHASRPPRGVDPLSAYGLELCSSSLPGPVLTRAWGRGLIDVPGHGDLIHAPSLAAPPARHAPLVVTVHDMTWRQVPDAFPARGRRWHEAAFARVRQRARRIVVPSESVAADVVSAGAAVSSIVVIPHGADHLPAPDTRATAGLLERLGVEGDFLLSVGTLEPRKNLGRLIEAYSRARPHLPAPWPLVVVGPSGWGENPPFGAGERPVDGVVPAGSVENGTLAGLYERARLLAYVPLREGFGLPPLEAMRQGIPVVTSPIPSVGSAGLVVDPEDIDDIASGLVRAATDDDLRTELVALGAARAVDLTWKASARAHVALWNSIA